MSKVPPEKPAAEELASLTWTPDFRSGYAEGFLAAVQLAVELSDSNLEALLAKWEAER